MYTRRTTPLEVADKVEAFGGWYTYWSLYDAGHTMREALWLLWIANRLTRHRNPINN